MKIKAQILNESGRPQASGFISNITGDDAVFELDDKTEIEKLKIARAIKFQMMHPTKGIMKYKGIVFSVMGLIIYIKQLEVLEVIQRREDVKAYMEVESKITPFLYESMGSTDVIIKDISCGGICLSSKNKLDTQIVYEIMIPFTRLPLELKFKVMRTIKSDNEGIFVYGCRFINLRNEEEAIIRSYVFKSQIEERNRLKQLEEIKEEIDEEEEEIDEAENKE